MKREVEKEGIISLPLIVKSTKNGEGSFCSGFHFLEQLPHTHSLGSQGLEGPYIDILEANFILSFTPPPHHLSQDLSSKPVSCLHSNCDGCSESNF